MPGAWTIAVVLLIWVAVGLPLTLWAGRALARAASSLPEAQPPWTGPDARWQRVDVPRQRTAGTPAPAVAHLDVPRGPGGARTRAGRSRRALTLGITVLAVTGGSVSAAAALGSLPGRVQLAASAVIEAVSPFEVPTARPDADRPGPGASSGATRPGSAARAGAESSAPASWGVPYAEAGPPVAPGPDGVALPPAGGWSPAGSRPGTPVDPASTGPGPTPTTTPPAVTPPSDTPPTGVPPTAVPPTVVPPTEVPPTDVPPTDVPPTDVPPTEVPPTDVPPTDVPPTGVPPTDGPLGEQPPADSSATSQPSETPAA